jgi:hypothetical protein
MTLHKLAVGEPYICGRVAWPERPDLSIGPHGAELRLFFRAPTDREVTAVRSGTAQFAWITGEHGALLCYRFREGIPWDDVSYPAAAEPADRAGLPGLHGAARRCGHGNPARYSARVLARACRRGGARHDRAADRSTPQPDRGIGVDQRAVRPVSRAQRHGRSRS